MNISVDNEKIKALTEEILFGDSDQQGGRTEHDAMTSVLEHLYSAMVAAAICGYTEDALDDLLMKAHDNVKDTYHKIREAAGEKFDA